MARVAGEDVWLRIDSGEVVVVNKGFISTIDDAVHGVLLMRPSAPVSESQCSNVVVQLGSVGVRAEIREAVNVASLHCCLFTAM